MCISSSIPRSYTAPIARMDNDLFSRIALPSDFRPLPQEQPQVERRALEAKPVTTSAPVANVKAQGAHIVVQHNYHDHANDSRALYQEEHPARGGVTTPFPLKLHEMLDNVARDNKEHIVSWQPHGRCFVVHKPKEFVELLPNYFKLSKLASFQRQLNLYGFQRLTRGRDRGGYYHELFLHGKVFLAHNIQRIKVKGTGVRARSNPDQEPDFWAMNWVTNDAAPQDVAAPVQAPMQYFPEELPTISRVVEKQAVAPLSLPVNQTFSMNNVQPVSEDQDVISAFGNKTFHYLDPFQKTPMEQIPQPQPQQTSWYNQGVDDLLSSEAESFFNDFDFPENIGSEIEDDNVFGDMLEQIIS